jgi:hypothetical protein
VTRVHRRTSQTVRRKRRLRWRRRRDSSHAPSIPHSLRLCLRPRLPSLSNLMHHMMCTYTHAHTDPLASPFPPLYCTVRHRLASSSAYPIPEQTWPVVAFPPHQGPSDGTNITSSTHFNLFRVAVHVAGLACLPQRVHMQQVR